MKAKRRPLTRTEGLSKRRGDMKQEIKEAKRKERWTKIVQLTKQPHGDTESRYELSQHSGHKEYSSSSFIWWSIPEMLCHQLAKHNIQGLTDGKLGFKRRGKEWTDLLNRIRQDGKREVKRCNSLWRTEVESALTQFERLKHSRYRSSICERKLSSPTERSLEHLQIGEAQFKGNKAKGESKMMRLASAKTIESVSRTRHLQT
jgi:hypothetical protein